MLIEFVRINPITFPLINNFILIIKYSLIQILENEFQWIK
jgi:hypothetical protein